MYVVAMDDSQWIWNDLQPKINFLIFVTHEMFLTLNHSRWHLLLSYLVVKKPQCNHTSNAVTCFAK